jgi:hypothetical protein
MNRNTMRLAELVALTLIAAGALWIAYVMVDQKALGADFAALLLIVSAVVNRISNLSQAQAMQSMADHLARSTPTNPDA